MTISKQLDAIGRQAREARARLKKHHNWTDWKLIGEALRALREQAMHEVGTNEPVGSAYNKVYGEMLRKYRLDPIDKGVRSRLASIMENISEVEAFLGALDLTDRLSLNHPNAVYRAWKGRTTVKPLSDRALANAANPARLNAIMKALTDRDNYIKQLEAATRREPIGSCSFCGRAHAPLFEGKGGVAICPSCVEEAREVQAAIRQKDDDFRRFEDESKAGSSKAG